MAKSLEDVLKEKGVITEEDYKSVTKAKPLDYKIGKGFTFASADDKFQLSLGGRLQARYTFTDKELERDSSEWRVRRMKLFMSGHAYTKDLTYKLQVNFADGGSSKILEDAWLNYKVLGMNEFQIQAGQDKVQFARQEITSSGAQQFVDRSLATDTFKAGRDTGLMLHGKIEKGLLVYNLGIYGGAGQSLMRDSKTGATNANAYAARLAVNPLGEMDYSEADLNHSEKPLVSVGANYYHNTLKRDTGTGSSAKLEANNVNFAGKWLGASNFSAGESVAIDTAGLDVAFKWLGGSAQAEYFLGQADGKDSDKTQRAHGFYAQAGYFLVPRHLEVAARYSYVDPDRDKGNDLKSEVQGAVSYYFNKHNLKVQADVTDTHDQSKGRTDDLQYRVQAQLIF